MSLEILDVIAFKEGGVLKHMIPYRHNGADECTAAYAKDVENDFGSLTQAIWELQEKFPNEDKERLEYQAVALHFRNQSAGRNSSGQDYPYVVGA